MKSAISSYKQKQENQESLIQVTNMEKLKTQLTFTGWLNVILEEIYICFRKEGKENDYHNDKKWSTILISKEILQFQESLSAKCWSSKRF